MKKPNFSTVALLAASCLILATACAPYDLTNSLGGKTLTYSYGRNNYESYAFNQKGDGGSFETRQYNYGYPTAAAEGDYTRKAWFQTGGYRGTFTYDADAHKLVFTREYEFVQIPGHTTAYSADYQEFTILAYWQAREPSCSSAVETYAVHQLFNQDGAMRVFASDGTGWSSASRYELDRHFGSDREFDSYDYVERFAIDDKNIAYSSTQDYTWQSNGATSRTFHYATDEASDVYAFYKVGGGDESAPFASLWKKGNILTFRHNRTSQVKKEWDGDTPPSAPAVDPATGIGAAGTQGTRPLNYYSIDDNLVTATQSFQHYGDFITYWTNAPGRAVE